METKKIIENSRDVYFEKKIEDFVQANNISKELWKSILDDLKEHQASCQKEHCHLCWRGDSGKW